MLEFKKAEELKLDTVSSRDMSLFGAFSDTDKIKFTMTFDADKEELDKITEVSAVIHKDAWNSQKEIYHVAKLERTGDGEFCGICDFSKFLGLWDDSCGLFYYHYLVKTADGDITLGGEGVRELETIENGIGERQVLVYDSSYKTSKSFAKGVVYHIFVDRFKRSGRCGVKNGAELNEDWDNGIPQYGEYPGAEVANNVFFGGDLYGIAEKLDYIAALGTKTIYLSPIFDAYSNHKYDTGDYLTVDEMFGGDEALEELCEKAREHDIEVILDGVFNHTGSDSIYFNRFGKYPSLGAYQSVDSPYYSWYSFREFPDDYECWWGVKILPRVNGSNKGFCSFICDEVVKKWMKLGVSGWRLDVADELDEGFLEEFRTAVKINNPDGVLIGEVWEDASDKVSYGSRRAYLYGGELDSVMNYPLRSAVIDYVKNGTVELMRKNSEGLYRRYPKCTSDNLMNFLGTHDTERILTILGGEEMGDKSNAELAELKMTTEERELARKKLKLAYGIIAGMPGSPCVFYGDEAGVEGYRDPFCRMPFPWKKIDEELLAFYHKIGTIRSTNTVFRDGIFEILHLDERAFCYERKPFDGGEDYKIVVCCARHGKVTAKIWNYGKNHGVKLPIIAENLVTDEKNSTFTFQEGQTAYLKCPISSSVEFEF